jgi:ribosomal-protein-alanine N-acetyltransferase
VALTVPGFPLRNIRLREFQTDDFESLYSIDQECFPPRISYSRTELKTYIHRRNAFTLVADSADGEDFDSPIEGKSRRNARPVPPGSPAIAGFIVAESEGGAGHIITIDVIAPARRFGVGSLLLRGAEYRLRAIHCRSVELETAVDNTSALAFYKRHGYNVIGTVPRYYSNGVDALVLEKKLEKELVKK